MESNLDLVRRYLEVLASGNLEAASDFFTENVVVHVPGQNPLAGDYRGKEGWAEYLARVNEATGGAFRIEPHDLLASDEHAVALAKIHAEVGGRSLTWNRVAVYHVVGEKISEIWLHDGDQHAIDEFLA